MSQIVNRTTSITTSNAAATANTNNTTRISLKPAAPIRVGGGGLKVSSNNVALKSIMNQNVEQRAALKDVAGKNQQHQQQLNQKPGPKVNNNDKPRPDAENAMVDPQKPKRAALKPSKANENKKAVNQRTYNNNDKVSKKSLKNSANKKAVNKAVEVKVTNQSQQPIAQSGVDFVIFCDDNDQLSLTAVQTDHQQQKTSSGQAEIFVDKENVQALEVKKQVLQDKRVGTVTLKEATNVALKKKTVVEVKPKSTAASTTTTTTTAATTTTNVTTATVQVRKPLEPKHVAQEAKRSQPTLPVNKNVPIKPVPKPKSLVSVEQPQVKKTVQPIPVIEIHDEEMKDCDSLVMDSLKLDESIITLDGTGIEEIDKENDPSLMSVDTIMNSTLEPSLCSMETFDLEVCTMYSDDIYTYILDRERQFMPNAFYMNSQPEVNAKMRSMLIDWLVDVSIEYKLQSETVFLAVNYVDRFLTSFHITLSDFQLLGTAALFVASKYEEIYPPNINEFIYITDDAYTKPQMLSMEQLLLKSLNFEISVPTTMYFLKKFFSVVVLPPHAEYFAQFICFMTLLHVDPFLHFTPSDVAICCILYTAHTFGIEDAITDEFVQRAIEHRHVDEKGIRSDAKVNLMRQACLDALYHLHKSAATCPQQAILQKYSANKFYSVAQREVVEQAPVLAKLLK